MGNIALFFFCLLAGGYVFWETGTYPPPADTSMNAALYPRILVCILLLLAGILAYKILKDRKVAGQKTPFRLPASGSMLLVLVMAAYCGLLALVGYALATIAFVFTATMLFRGTVKDGVIVSLGITIFLEALFRGGFQVPLPTGALNLF